MTPQERAEKIWHRGAPYFGARDKNREIEFITAQIEEAIAEREKEILGHSYRHATLEDLRKAFPVRSEITIGTSMLMMKLSWKKL